MLNHQSSSCTWIGAIAIALLTAIALQFFIILIGVAVTVGVNGYLWHTVYRLLSWPIFFMSLLVSLILMCVCCIKCCLMRQCHPAPQATCDTVSHEQPPASSN